MKRTRVKELFRQKEVFAEKEVTICGWVRSNRSQAQFGFLNVNDGSFFDNLQVVYPVPAPVSDTVRTRLPRNPPERLFLSAGKAV